MIGQLLLESRNNAAIVRLEDDGTWTAAEDQFKPLADYLNSSFSPTADRQTGDGAQPFGVAALHRAGASLKGVKVLQTVPTPPLPEGAVS